MDESPDLSIVLTPPPSGSSPEIIASVSLKCEAVGLNHTGELLRDPLTQIERDDLRWYLEEYWQWPYEGFARRGRQIEALLPELGRRLYQAVFERVKETMPFQLWYSHPAPLRQISIVSDIPRILSLPWELLHDEQGFLVLRESQSFSILRCLSKHERITLPESFELPLRILLVSPRPVNAGFVDPRSIARELLDEMQEQIDAGSLEVEFLHPPTFSRLRARLEDHTRPVHILHFDGHGLFHQRQSMLAFENDGERLTLVKASDVRTVLHTSGVRLIVFTACQSSISHTDDALSSVATQLIQGEGGVDAVIAMSASILTISAARYAKAFYHSLARGTAAQVAHERARHALYENPRRHLHRRWMSEQSEPIEVHDWWLPHFYQRRPLLLRPSSTRGTASVRGHFDTSSVQLSEEIPTEPCYGFVGRATELFRLDRLLRRGKLVVIHGFGGIGKTVLAREAADWLTRTRMYDGACFIAFEHGGNVTRLLSALGTFLGVNDDHFDPMDNAAALPRLKAALKMRCILVIADNLESVELTTDTPTAAEAGWMQLWDVLLELTAAGAGVLLTCRSIPVRDEQLLTAKPIAYLELNGLHPQDAYLFAIRLLDDPALGIDRKRISYIELRDLLKQIDHHPLAIQLVLPRLSELSASKIISDFATLLPTFVDDSEVGRNRSLLISLEYSLRGLGEEQRSLLPLLAPFEGGANESSLLEITKIPKDRWYKLRLALERAGLLTLRRNQMNFNAPLLHFHPILTPFLRNLSPTQDNILYERYIQEYFMLIGYFYQRDSQTPQIARAITYYEMPNILKGIELLLEMQRIEEASEMLSHASRFLTFFGWLSERDGLWRRIERAAVIQSAPTSEGLTWVEFRRESDLSELELEKGDINAAFVRTMALLARIELLSKHAPLASGTLEHSQTLRQLAHCLQRKGNYLEAEERLREAMTNINTLIDQRPNKQFFIQSSGVFLIDLGNVLVDQGQHEQARKAYEEALSIATRQNDLRQLAVALGQLGQVAQKQQDYKAARLFYGRSLDLFQTLNEPKMKALAWHQLGYIAQEQRMWSEAEQYYRKSLEMSASLGDGGATASTCYNLAMVAVATDRPDEAEGWLRRALKLYEQVGPRSPSHAKYLFALANFVVNGVQKVQISSTRLLEAQFYAEQALVILEASDESAEVWHVLNALSTIAFLSGQLEKARDYRQRELDTYAVFAEKHLNFRQGTEAFVEMIVDAVNNQQARAELDPYFSELETTNTPIVAAIRRMYAGERDWYTLTGELNRVDSLVILRVLEKLQQAFEAELKVMMQYINYLEDELASIQFYEQRLHESLLQNIVAIAVGDRTNQSEVEVQLETTRIKDAVQRIWGGERDEAVLTQGLQILDQALIRWVLRNLS